MGGDVRRTRSHGPILRHLEQAIVAAYAAGPMQGGPWTIEPDRDSDRGQERRQDDQARERSDEIEDPLEHAPAVSLISNE